MAPPSTKALFDSVAFATLPSYRIQRKGVRRDLRRKTTTDFSVCRLSIGVCEWRFLAEMAEEQKQEVEVKNRGLFDFMGTKEAVEKKNEEEVLVAGVEKVHIEEEKKEEKEEEKKESLLSKLHRSHSSSSSSSSDEEEGEGENKEKKKQKKKGLVENIKEKIGGEKKEGKEEEKQAVVEQEVAVAVVSSKSEDSAVKVEKVEESIKVEGASEEEKKGFLEKIKGKLPGHHKKSEEATSPTAECAGHGTKEHETDGHEAKEKKGILGKLMEKLPGYHKNGGEESEKGSATH